jgi:dolichol kinase
MVWFRSWFPELIASAMRPFYLDDNLVITATVGLLAFFLDR